MTLRRQGGCAWRTLMAVELDEIMDLDLEKGRDIYLKDTQG